MRRLIKVRILSRISSVYCAPCCVRRARRFCARLSCLYLERPLPRAADSTRLFTAELVVRKKQSRASEVLPQRGRIEFWLEDLARVNDTVIDALTKRFMRYVLKPENFEKGLYPHSCIVSSPSCCVR